MIPDDRIRVLLLADTHLGFDDPLRPRSPLRRRGPDFRANWRRALADALSWPAQILVHGGDLFTSPRVHGGIVDAAYGDLLDLADRGVEVAIVPGNHERSRLPASLLLGHPRIHVFDEARTFRLRAGGNRVALSGFPFQRRVAERLPELTARLGDRADGDELALLCMHQAVEGATVGPAGFVFRGGRDVVARETLPAGYAAVLCGHVHRRQTLWGPRGERGRRLPILYPGSTERTSFAERFERKGFCRIEFLRADRSWSLDSARFVELPTRPLAEIDLGAAATRGEIRRRIVAGLREIDPDSVLRLRCDSAVAEAVRGALGGGWLASALPGRMSFHYGASLFGGGRDGVE